MEKSHFLEGVKDTPVLKGLNLSLKRPLTQGEKTNRGKNQISKLPRLSKYQKVGQGQSQDLMMILRKNSLYYYKESDKVRLFLLYCVVSEWYFASLKS